MRSVLIFFLLYFYHLIALVLAPDRFFKADTLVLIHSLKMSSSAFPIDFDFDGARFSQTSSFSKNSSQTSSSMSSNFSSVSSNRSGSMSSPSSTLTKTPFPTLEASLAMGSCAYKEEFK